MEYNVDIFREQFPIVKTFLYHLTCYRELHRIYQNLNLKSEFWTHTIDAHLLQAAILWCMVFGSHGCNSTHWKNLSDQDREKLEDSFRDGLFNNTELNQEKWDAYWKDMNDFRGGYAAHRELNYDKPVPHFKTAEEVAYFYDKWIRELIEPDILEEPPLKKSVSMMQSKIRPMAMHCLSQTKLMKPCNDPTGEEEMNEIITQDAVDIAEKSFSFPELLQTEYFRKYRKSYYEMPKRGFSLGPRNYLNLLRFLDEIFEYNEQHANGLAKAIRSGSKDWRNCEAVFSEIIVYRYYLRLVYEGYIKSILRNNDECDIIIEMHDGSRNYLEVFCVMPNLKTSIPDEIVLNDIKTHTQCSMASIRQKLLRKVEKQKQFTKPRNNFAVIELNDISIAGDFAILSSLSNGFKVTINKDTMETVSSGYDWSQSVFDNESTKFLKGIIYFDLGDYNSRKFIYNNNFKQPLNSRIHGLGKDDAFPAG